MFTLTNDGNPKIRLNLNFNVNIQYIILKAKFHMLCFKNFFASIGTEPHVTSHYTAINLMLLIDK